MLKQKQAKDPQIVRYQAGDEEYAYSGFWQGREYDQKAERLLLRKIFKKYFQSVPKTGWLVDIGGNFGRLIPAYAPFFQQVAILDYAYNEFHLAQKTAQRLKVELYLIRGNAYYLPFSDNSQRYLISVRVIHHLENPVLFLQEIKRILQPGGTFIFQTANKDNLKTLVKSCFTLRRGVWSAPYEDIGRSGMQDDGSFVLIRNYSARYLERLIRKQGLKIVHKRSISWLRYFKWARKFTRISFVFERFLQIVGIILPMGPSNWYVIQRDEQAAMKPKERSEAAKFTSTLYSHATKKAVDLKSAGVKKKTKQGVDYYDLLYPRE